MTSSSITDGAAASSDVSLKSNVTDEKMFFTTSDLLDRMNSAMKDANPDGMPGDGSTQAGFELQTKMPDGSYRRAEEKELAAADFQAKMKQASLMIADYDPPQKIEWAKRQRQEGNRLFSIGNYKEAMDVYLTCLVAMDSSRASSANDGDSVGSDEQFGLQIEKDIKLPILLNLALSAIKLGMLSKAEKFCNYAIDSELGRRSAKAHFRRGSVRRLMGHYATAKSDLERALELDCTEDEKVAIMRETRKLERLVHEAYKNRRRQKAAMVEVFNSNAKSLYPERKGPILQIDEHQTNWFEWYVLMIGRCARKIYDSLAIKKRKEQ